MEFVVENLTGVRVAYTRRVGPYGAANAVQMDELKRWAAESGLLVGEITVWGIPQDDPSVADPQSCRYDACIEIAEAYDFSDHDVAESRVPGGRYAVFTIDHTAEGVANGWMQVYSALAVGGHELDLTRPPLERYSPALLQRHLCELAIPVR